MKNIILTTFIAILAAFVGVKLFLPAGANGPAPAETAYERVIRTGELRCGYFNGSPYFMKDVATGAMTGIWHDATEEVGKNLGLKIVWAEGMGLGDVPTALKGNRIDMFCSGLWSPGARLKAMTYLNPMAFEPVLVYVRADDHRFDNDVSLINNKNIRISTIDGEAGALIAEQDFPLATKASLPQLASMADMFNQVVFKKADVFLNSPSAVAEFNKHNPGKLRALANKPLRVYPISYYVKNNEDTLRTMVNNAIRNVLYSGVMDTIIHQYETDKGHEFWRVAPAYTMPAE